jgi:hypothetical protein|tara:strand:+ start:1395 stop:1670 length:276 start_codon:yes stop_codon:yes gene_type:complete
MGRTVGITKVGATTIVEITDDSGQNEKRCYNRSCNLYSAGNNIAIGASNPFPELRIQFSEIVDKLSTANADDYIDEIVKPANGLFNENVVL